MAMFSVKGSAKWGDSTEEKQLHSSLFDSPVSSKNARKSTSPDQKQTAQASKKKPRKRKNSKNYDNFTSIKNPKKTEPHLRHLVIPVPVKDATTKDQHDIEDRSQIYPQSRENSPPPSPKKKKKRRRKDSVGSDSDLTGSKGHEKSLKIKRKNRNRLNSQGDEQNVNKTIHQQRKRTTSVSSIGSDSSLGSPKQHFKKSKLKSKNLDNIRTDKGDNKQGGDQSSPRINAQGDEEQDGGEREEEPKRKKRKRKPRNNKFKKSEGNEKSESKVSHPAVEQRSNVSELSVSNHLPSEVRTNGSTLVKEENRTKQKRKFSSENDSKSIKKNQVRQKQVANYSKVNRTLPTKDPSSTETHVNLQSQEVKPSHTKKKNSSELKVHHKEETTLENARETADQKNGSLRTTKGTRKQHNETEPSHTKENSSSGMKMLHKEETFSEKAKETVKQQRRARKKRRRKRHSESELENTEVENLPAVKMLNNEDSSEKSKLDTADQGHNSKQKKRAHKRSSKGRKKQAQVAQPKSAATKVKAEKEEVLESESEDEGEKVLESVVQSEGLLHRVSRVKNGSKNKEEKKLVPSTADQSDSSDEESDDSPVKNEQSQQNLKGLKERKGQSQKSRLESQLRSSHFRFLNEKLYQCSGSEAYEMMTEDKDAFEIYHEGYSQQVEQWPVNPVNVFIKYLKSKPSSVVVGDFGCGEAQIAQSVKQKVHSFDLCAMNKYVTVCDIASVPLDDESLDVAVFCLSLMGTNWIDYIKEANRVLKTGGVLKIAEVASRFQSLAAFIKIMKSLGFNSTSKDLSNKMFSLFDFTKQKQYRNIDVDKGDVLKPCLYKKR